VTDLNTPDVEQPDQSGQDDGGGGAPYQEYLDRIPEQFRGDVEPVFKDWDANVTRRFQDNADFRKQWEPLSETGIHQLDPDAVSWLVQLHAALEQPDIMQQWWDSYAQENGLTDQSSPDSDDGGNPTLDEFGMPDDQRLEKLLEDKLGQLTSRLDQYDQRFAQSDQQAAEREAQSYVDGQLQKLAEEHNGGKPFDQKMIGLIDKFASSYIESDARNAIPKGFADLQQFLNERETLTLQGKLDQPPPAEGGGVPAAGPEKHKRIDDPAVRQQVRDMLRNMNSG
jgi:hypothetical protein